MVGADPSIEDEEHTVLIDFISIEPEQECLIKIRDNYYKALAVECGSCGMDFRLLEEVPYELDYIADGFDGSVIMGNHYLQDIKEDPTLIISFSENDISFWRHKHT